MILLQLQRSSHQPIEVPEVSGIQLKSLDDLRMLEENSATNVEYKQKLITVLGLAGGLTVKDTVWRVMAKVMTNQLAKMINWRGVNGKSAFEPLGIKDVVLRAVRRNQATADASDGDIEAYIKRWLQLAPDRDGGRRSRALRQAERDTN